MKMRTRTCLFSLLPGSAQVDLSYGLKLTIGSASRQWGANLKADVSQSSRQRENRCELRLVYDVLNPGSAPAEALVSRVREGQRSRAADRLDITKNKKAA